MDRRTLAQTRATPLHLAIVQEPSFLSIALSDLRSLAVIEQAALDRVLLGEIRAALGRAAPDDMAFAAEAIFSRLLPPRVAAALRSSPPRDLRLQLSEPIADIPWELAFNGKWFLGTQFSLSRQILGDGAAVPEHAWPLIDEACQVLLPAPGGDASTVAYRREVAAAIGGAGPYAVQTPGGNELADRLGSADIVHCIGRPEEAGLDLTALGAQAQPPRLIVIEGDADTACVASWCAAASRAGLNLLVRPLGKADEPAAEFIAELYRQIALGVPFDEALRQVRARAQAMHGSQRHTDLLALYCGSTGVAAFSSARRAAGTDNLRQVAIMSYDLVSSTRLIGQLGAEKYSELLSHYHHVCGRIVRRHGGLSDTPQGDDGIMCYFGVHTADENASAQCVRAALQIVEAVAQLGVHVRVGINTGQVAVRTGQPVGMPVHLAARLQSIAEPGTVVVSEATRQLTRRFFEFEPLAALPPLKGFEAPLQAHRVKRELRFTQADPIEAASRPTPLVGRDAELGALEAHWSAAREAGLRAVVVHGEAGIGKSRLTGDFGRRLRERGYRTIECCCTPHHASSAFHPVIGWLCRQLDIQDQDSAEIKRQKIAAAMAGSIGLEGAEAVVGALLSVPPADGHAAAQRSAQRQRELTLEVLLRWVERQAQGGALCLLIDDVQWIDPSTSEFLELLASRAAALPVLLLATLRSDRGNTWQPGFAVQELALHGLSPEHSRQMVAAVAGRMNLAPEILRQLASHGDGVPLFIEESTRMALETAPEAANDAAASLRRSVPSTIHDLLMARLDRLAPAKQVAQVGATIGREFSYGLLEAVLAHEAAALDADSLRARLDLLVQAGLLHEKPRGVDTRYVFKHALVRDAAYQSLWERDRKRLHRAIAHVVQYRFVEFAETQPELLAYHYTEADLPLDAIRYWEQAARRAAARSAHHEAIAQLGSALALVPSLADGGERERERVELRLQLLLASRLIATDGYGADRVERVYSRAEALARRTGDTAALTKILLGLEGYHFMRADFDKAHAIAAEAARAAEPSADPMQRIQSTWAVSNIRFHQGHVHEAVALMDECLREYDRIPHRPSAVQDPGVMCLCYSAWGKWELGEPDEALRRARQVVALAERLDHRFSMGEAWGFCTTVHYFRGEYEEALRCAERAIEICKDGGFAVWLAHAEVMHGRLVAQLRDPEAGNAQMRRAYRSWAATGAVVTRAFYLAMQAEGLALAQRPDDGLALLEVAYELVSKVKEGYYEPEIHRLIGELSLQSGAQHGQDRSVEATRWFSSALELARQRRLRSLAVRSATSLAELWIARGRAGEAAALLQGELAGFTEGLQTRDLRRVHKLMEAAQQHAGYPSAA